MSKYWIKLYHEILDDPKIGRLSEHLRWRMVELFLLAGIENNDGRLPNIEDMAWRLRTEIDAIQVDLELLQDCHIVTCLDGEWTVTKFAERQRPSTDAERMQQYRKQLRKEELIVTNRNGNVTGSLQKAVQDTDTDTDINPPTAETPEEKRKKKTLDAMNRGLEKDGQIKQKILELFRLSPNWEWKGNRVFLEWAKERKPGELERFSEWWFRDDWRGKSGQSPTLAQVMELWPQAFKGAQSTASIASEVW